jgi:hypothetical protein
MTFQLLVLTLLACVYYCFIRLDEMGSDDSDLARQQEPPLRSAKDPGTQRWRPRFTIRSVMTAIAVLAGLLAVHAVVALILISLFIPYFSRFVAQWLVRRQRLPLAASAFWTATTFINVCVAVSCIAPKSKAFYLIFLGLWVTGVPTIANLGSAWVALLTQKTAAASRFREADGVSVLLLGLLPSLTLVTLWPLRLGFLIYRGEMEGLASQVAAGTPLRFPRRVGVFHLTSPATRSGYVGLRTDTERVPTSGFVRLAPGGTANTNGPIVGVTFDVYLGSGWWYRG